MNLEETMIALSQSPNATARRIGRMLTTARSAAMRDDARAASAAADRIDRAAETLTGHERNLAEWAREHARDFAHNIAMRDGRDFFSPAIAPTGRRAAEAATRAARAAAALPFAGVASRLSEIVSELAELRAASTCAGSRLITAAAITLCDAIEAQNARDDSTDAA